MMEGPKIDSYVIEMLKTGTEDWVRVAEGDFPPPSICSQVSVEGQEYSFRVRAVNKAGKVEPSGAPATLCLREKLCKSLLIISSLLSGFLVTTRKLSAD